MANLALLVNDLRYEGWKSVRVTRSIESISGGFELEVTDRWTGQDERWPIREEDACRVEVYGEVVIDGYVDRRSLAISGDSRTTTVSGRDAAAALVDSSVVLDRWAFRSATVLDIARKLAEPFGLSVSLQAGLVLPRAERKIAVNPGESAYDVIARAAAAAGVLAVSDGDGGIVLTRAGAARAAPISEGTNLLEGSVEFDASERYGRYVVVTQLAGTDTAAADATRVRAEATDEGVRRSGRVLLIQPEAGITTAYARHRADWEARVRAARAETVTATVVGWRQPGGDLWPVNALCRVTAPSLGVGGGDMLISQVEFTLGDSGELARLSLVRPDAFTPEPRAVVKANGPASGGDEWWKNL